MSEHVSGDGIDHDAFSRLHYSVRLRHGKRQDGGLTSRFVRALDHSAGSRTLPTAADYTQAALIALRRLDAEAPQAALVVRACCVEGQTEVQAAATLGMGKSTINRVKLRGLSIMAEHAGIDLARIRYELRHLDDMCA